jgi:lipoprotein-releasing system permease protein
MSFEQTIALRYLRSKRQFGFITIISLISIVGVTVGVAALLVVLSVFNGFSGLVSSILINFDPHLRIETTKQSTVETYQQLIEYCSTHREVTGIAPIVTGKAVIVSRNLNRVINIKGIESDKIAGVSGLHKNLVLGSIDFKGEKQNGMVIGMTLADRLGAVVGDTVAVVSLAGSEIALLQFGQPLIRRFHIVGIYESSNREYDAAYAFVGLEAAQALFGMGKRVNGVELRLRSLNDANHFKSELEERFAEQFRLLTWYDLHRDLYSVMKIERWMAYIILCLIIGVASFNLLGSLTMAVIEKTREIGILKSMGATRRNIVRIFLFEGIFVGVIGAVVGVGIGLGVVALQEKYHLFALDPTVYIIPAIPVEVHAIDVVIVAFTAIALCSVAALYPAWRAASLDPVEAIRWE